MAKHIIIGNSVSLIETLDLLGGRLCLDFTNTMDPRIGEHPRELLNAYPDLVVWSQHASVLTQEQSNNLLHDAQNRFEEATEVFKNAIVLRESLYGMFSTLATGGEPHRADMENVRRMFASAMTYARLSHVQKQFTWEWDEHQDRLDCMMWPIVCSAVSVLTSEEWQRVKQCPGLDDCGWLFLDTSKNGSRQWCSMQACGSRAKMRRQYARKRTDRL